MENYRTSAHTRFDIKYHFVWTTKYRKEVLTSQVALRLRELVREVCRTNDIEILQGHVAKDHVHILVSAPPNMSASKIMQYVKGKTSRKLMMEFRHLNKTFWGRHMWVRGFFVATSGNVTDEVIQEYIRLQGREPPSNDDAFRVEAHPSSSKPSPSGEGGLLDTLTTQMDEPKPRGERCAPALRSDRPARYTCRPSNVKPCLAGDCR